jgi:uncharacterized repeat protein (TIGR03803 family)
MMPRTKTLRWLTSTLMALAVCAFLPHEASAQTYKVLYNFASGGGSLGNGGPLIQGLDGNIWGGGTGEGTYGDGGSIFKMTPAGKYTPVYTFCSLANCADGQGPGGLILGRDGNYYGITTEGGANSSIDCNGESVSTCGSVFRLTAAGVLTTLYSFCAQPSCTDGSHPQGNLLIGSDGEIYGITAYGGTGSACVNDGTQPTGCGTVFKITLQGKLTTIYSFCVDSCVPGDTSEGGLTQLQQGRYMATANSGGTGSGGPQCEYGCGTIFDITSVGDVTSLYNFCVQDNCPDGAHPSAGLVLGTNGVFYGTSLNGGAGDDGTIFSFTTPGNHVKTLHSFCVKSGCPDGEYPDSALIQAADGVLYGNTPLGGTHGGGTLFSITTAGDFTTLHEFCVQQDCFDGLSPVAQLVQATSGIMYGIAGGGNPGNGVVYSLTVPNEPTFVNVVPAFSEPGGAVKILGYGLADTSAVTFNGAPATFTAADSHINATVPAGATSGIVQVTTPDGTLSTLVPFTVE